MIIYLVEGRDDKMMLRVFKQLDVRNRAYVIDNKGNKLFYGTLYQCKKFVEFIKEEMENEQNIKNDSATERKERC